MPWRIEAREDEWCVIKETDGSVAGCHASRTQALKQQRALYAQESQTAAANGTPDPVRVELSATRPDIDEALVASITAVSERLLETEDAVGQIALLLKQLSDDVRLDRTAFQEALTAAVQVAPQEPPIVNVTVPVPEVKITVPKSRFAFTNPTPVVNVTIPGSKKTITFERDPLTGGVSKAEINEDLE